jgi:hypothetical protein
MDSRIGDGDAGAMPSSKVRSRSNG